MGGIRYRHFTNSQKKNQSFSDSSRELQKMASHIVFNMIRKFYKFTKNNQSFSDLHRNGFLEKSLTRKNRSPSENSFLVLFHKPGLTPLDSINFPRRRNLSFQWRTSTMKTAPLFFARQSNRSGLAAIAKCKCNRRDDVACNCMCIGCMR